MERRDRDGSAGSSAGDAGACNTETVVVGFDALSSEYLEAFDLPHFDALRAEGISAPLDSTFPPWTGSAWPSMYTGVDPSHHGVYSFFDFSEGYPDDASLVSRNDVDAPAIWNYLSATGTRSVVLNVPVTHPAEPIDGVLIPGYLAPEAAAGYPDGIRAELSTALGEDYRIYARREVGAADAGMLESYVNRIDCRRRAARALLERVDPAVAIFQVQKTDTVFHQFDDEDAFRRVYEAADAFLGTILETVGEGTNVVVCSDHGMGPAQGDNVYVNEILREAGQVEPTQEGETPTFGESKHHLAGEDGTTANGAGLTSRAVSGIAAGLSRIGVQPGDVYAAASRVGVDGVLRQVIPDTDSLASHVDWAASRAYCRSGPELGVRINLEGREPAGVVSPAAYDAVREQLIETLRAVRTPAGEPAFDWVRPREAVYDGPHATAACDVLFSPAGMQNIVTTNLIGTSFVPIDKYNHRSTGVFVGAGPGFDTAGGIDALGLPDVAPIVMALAGQPVPARMTGSVPSGLLRDPVDVQEYEDLGYGTGTAVEEDDRVEARLADLGYL